MGRVIANVVRTVWCYVFIPVVVLEVVLVQRDAGHGHPAVGVHKATDLLRNNKERHGFRH